MTTFKSLTGTAASLLIATALASTANAQVVTISDFSTLNQLGTFVPAPPFDSSWIGDVIIEGGHTTIGASTATHSGIGAVSFAPLDLLPLVNTGLALTASRINDNNNGFYTVILQSGPNNATGWLYDPSLFVSVPGGAGTADQSPLTFSTVTLDFTAGFLPNTFAGLADLTAVTTLIMTGDGASPVFEARFDNLAAVPEPSQYGIMAGLGLLGFAVYRRFAGKSATVQA